MGISAKRAGIAFVVLSAGALGSIGLADAASTVMQHRRSGHAAVGTAPGTGGRGGESLLTGATLQSASSAATAAVSGARVDRASVESPGDRSRAAYEVHVTKTDGSRAKVLEDSSFKVLSVDAGHGRGPGGRRGNPSETVLSGPNLKSAGDAAVAAVPGGTVSSASAEDKTDKSGAAYEVHVAKADGSEVRVLEDSAFKILSVTAGPHPHGGRAGRGGRGGPDGPRPFGPGH